jgi:hypothetical protein
VIRDEAILPVFVAGLGKLSSQCLQRIITLLKLFDTFQVKCNKLGKKSKHAPGFGVIDHCGPWVNSTERSKHFTVMADNGDRNVTLKAIHFRRVVVTEMRIFGYMINDNWLTTIPYFVTDCSFKLQLAAWLQSE